MIVPRNRLLFWFGLVAPLFALLAALEPAGLGVALAAIACLVALALADGLGAWRNLAGISLTVPRVARMSHERDARLEVRLRNPRRRPRTLHLALALPREFHSAKEDAWVTLPPDSEWSQFTWRCRPLRRGNYRLQTARIEIPSPLGFWTARKTLDTPAELRVYPNLLPERRDLAALFLHRGASGLHAQRQLGKGREFEKLREYMPGDSYDEIHWKATARRGRPITKVFQIERTQEVYVVLDASRLSGRPAADRKLPSDVEPDEAAPAPETGSVPPPTTLDRFLTAALVLGLAAEQQGDLFGLLTFSDKIDRFIRARNGKAHYSTCRDALYTLEPRRVTPDYEEVFTFIRLRLRRRALLVFLTALDDPVLAESFVRQVDLVRRQHLLLVNMLPPAGVAPLFSNSAVASVDDLYEHLGGHLRWQTLRQLEQVLRRRGIAFSLLKNERLSASLVSQYLNIKRRQSL